MRLHIKSLICIFLLASFFSANNAVYAEVLSFKPGDKASYTISQKKITELSLFGLEEYEQSETTIDLDIEILSSNQETSSYPFDVEVTLKKILLSEIQQNDPSATAVRYEYLGELINYPLIFRVEKDFQIKETTGYLAQICERDDSQIDEHDDSLVNSLNFGITPWTFEQLLTQLFHLSGKDLLLATGYPVSCYQFLNWDERELLDEQEISIDQSSAYIINTIDSKNIEASWQGNALVACVKNYMDGEVSLVGNVTWDITNPMIQKRDLEIKTKETYRELIFPIHIDQSIQQTWQSHPSYTYTP